MKFPDALLKIGRPLHINIDTIISLSLVSISNIFSSMGQLLWLYLQLVSVAGYQTP